jgi:hypothetical protein
MMRVDRLARNRRVQSFAERVKRGSNVRSVESRPDMNSRNR